MELDRSGYGDMEIHGVSKTFIFFICMSVSGAICMWVLREP